MLGLSAIALLLLIGLAWGIFVRLKGRALLFAGRRPHREPPSCCPQYFSFLPSAWLAIKSHNVSEVQVALSLHNPRPCSWLEGLTNADKLFIAPPVKGWILVTGMGLPEPSQDVDACFRVVSDLSRRLGKVQFFGADRHSHFHAWVKAKNGRIERAYAWAGETLWQQGRPTADEARLAMVCFEYAEGLACAEAILQANVEKVPRLAALWGLDPAQIAEHLPTNEHGISGKLARRY